MDIKDINKLISEYEKDEENLKLKKQYADEMSSYLQNNKLSEELMSVIVKGVTIDEGANFLDYLDTATEKELDGIWKKLSSSKTIKNGKSKNSLILLMQLFYCGVIDTKKYGKYIGRTLELIISIISDKEKGYSESIYGPIFIEYFVNQIIRYEQLPDWSKLRISPEISNIATSLLLKTIHFPTNNKQMLIVYNWLKNGNEYAVEQARINSIEQKIPVSKIPELEGIINHYKDVEAQIRKYVYNIDSLNGRIEELNASIDRLNGIISHLKKEKDILEINLKKEIEENSRFKAEIERLRILSVAQIDDKTDSIQSLLNEIGRSLKAEYEDYYLTKNEEMNEMLGEIYRGKLDNIAKILKRKGIKVQE